ncbi:MAG: hypothetical protein JSS49_15280 [Planctomycetes bacterium]|nr:hypothetical protein [Planctomycetota bacterium]
MARTFRSLVWCFGLAVGAVTTSGGCTHLIETRTITEFSKHLKDEDLKGLLQSTSGEFRQRALRTATAMEDLKILNLPDGKTAIVEVEDLSEDKKRVTVQVGEGKKEVFYELAKDRTGHWVVDDIYLKQKRKGVEAYKSVTEQMDLLLSVREFLDTWNRGDRDKVLSVATTEFRDALDPLPPSFLASLTRIVSAGKPGGKYKPNAQIDEKIAVVRLPRGVGDTVVTLELEKGHWLVSDVAVDAKNDDALPSMLKLATAVNGCTSFLAAYSAGDKSSLAKWSSPDFFEGSLAIGDLSIAKLPDAQLSEHELQVKLRGNRADFVLKNDTELVQIDMHKAPTTEMNAPEKYLVSDVTIYEIESKQEKRLSALFTAQGMLEIFAQALATRDLSTLKHSSTRDLTTRVWSRLNNDTIGEMPLEMFDGGNAEFVNTTFLGALTRVEARQGGRTMTFVLREENGRFFVDDVNWQLTGLPASLKTTLEILVPIHEFASAIAQGRDSQSQQQALERLQAISTTDFNRLVWTQTKFVPNSGMSADTFLKSPLKGIAIADKEVIVHLGDNRYGATVTLRREFERFVVDDVQLIAGVEESQRMALKQTLQTQMSRGEARAPSAVIHASATEEVETTPREIDDPFAVDLRE